MRSDLSDMSSNGKNVSFRTWDRYGPDYHQWPALDVGARHRFLAPARLAGLIERGVKGSRRALALASDPGKFLSTVQIGITLISVLSGAFSGATLGLRLTAWLVELGLPHGLADAIGVGAVVTIITYASLIVGELVPKQIALRDPEAVAVRVAPYMVLLSKVSLPLVWLLHVERPTIIGHLLYGTLMGRYPSYLKRPAPPAPAPESQAEAPVEANPE